MYDFHITCAANGCSDVAEIGSILCWKHFVINFFLVIVSIASMIWLSLYAGLGIQHRSARDGSSVRVVGRCVDVQASTSHDEHRHPRDLVAATSDMNQPCRTDLAKLTQ